jgi:hypothetical protein
MSPQKILTLSYDESKKNPTERSTTMGSIIVKNNDRF